MGVKRAGREADHSPPSITKVKNVRRYTSTPQHTFMAWCSFKAQGQLSPLRAQNRCDTPHCAADLNFGIEISSFTVEWLKKLNRWLVACDSMQSHQRTGNIKQDEET
jgi:hypothetical protein